MVRIIENSGIADFLNEIKGRNAEDYSSVNDTVERILKDVEINKDEALKRYTHEFDNVDLESFEVTEKEIDMAFKSIDKELLEAIKKAKENIFAYHLKQKNEGYRIWSKKKDILLGQLIRPMERVGIYIPGGKAAYPSTVLMNAIPARIAGVEELIMITPPGEDGSIRDSVLVAASLTQVDRIFKVGGAQGIGALTYGTESIPKVHKITGPGNIYVAAAKRQVSGIVGIDMIAGPSEILIIADEHANPVFIAADMISQAEHDEMAASILITDSRSLSEKVQNQLEKQLLSLERKSIAEKALKDQGAIIIADSIYHCIDIANEIAPEHLELMVTDPFNIYERIKNAGAIFIGEYSPEPVGDYYAGPNHILPTSSTARFSSALSVDDFTKKISLIYYDEKALAKSARQIIKFAESEGLNGHANAVKVRMEELHSKREDGGYSD